MMKFVLNTRNCVRIENEELFIENEELCIENDEFCR